MEKTVTNFESPEISIKLTEEKIYIKTPATSETFALRSINGIGIVDLVDRYNQELSENKAKNSPLKLYLLGGFFLALGIASLADSIKYIGTALFFLILGAGLIYWGTKKQANKPTLLSAVRIMISGMNRDFEFDKSGTYTTQIAELVVKVEETLTAYHKNNK
jgi:hypothetical protein